uniref:Polyprotein n=1 Tax=Krauss' spikemoss associated endorna-like virus TaxID=2933173 RepID=A0A9C7GWM4_9VIRU|nr:polyprotein [Krauss' spikemoss associated endorna-like virus]CAI5383962.1 polyprotein [Krauss' spikemoss associated endorna-like virus]
MPIMSSQRTSHRTCGPSDRRGCDINLKNKKLSARHAQIYHVGMQPADNTIPELQLRHCKYTDYMYIDTFFGELADTEHTDCIGINGIINIYHNMKVYPCASKFTIDKFNGNTSCYINGKYFIDTKDPPAESDCNYCPKRYRRQVIAEVTKRGKQSMLQWLSEKSKTFPIGKMSQVFDGALETLPGWYIKCNCCDAMSYMPLSTLLPHTLTREQLVHVINILQCQTMNPDTGMLDLDPELYGFEASMLGFIFNNAKMYCYNCGAPMDEYTRFVPTEFKHLVPIPQDYGIHGISLEQAKLCLYLDKPPPESIDLARKLYTEMANNNINHQLSRLEIQYLNSVLDCINTDNYRLLQRHSGVVFNSNQNLMSANITQMELEEILLTAEFSVSAGGNIYAQPSNMNVYHSLYDITTAVTTSTWFSTTELMLNTQDPGENQVMLLNASTIFDVETAMLDESYVLVPIVREGDHVVQDSQYMYTESTGSNVPVRWNKKLINLVNGNCAVRLNGDTYNIQTIRNAEKLCIIKFTKTQTPDIRMLAGRRKLEVYLPVLDPNSILQTFGIVGAEWQYVSIDVDLTYRILINALSGKKSLDSILTYVAGIASTKYSIGGHIVDLTKTNIAEGVPELIYALIIMNDNNRLMEWCKLNYVSNVSITNATSRLYNFILNRFVRQIHLIDHPLINKINELIKTSATMMFKRDSILLKAHGSVNITNLLAFEIIDKIVDFHSTSSPVVRHPNNCHHHQLACNHMVDSNQCACCGYAAEPGSTHCACCATSRICLHKCNHRCLKPSDHMCYNCQVAKKRSHHVKCRCCSAMGCAELCTVCDNSESVELPPVYNKDHKIKPPQPPKTKPGLKEIKALTPPTTRKLEETGKRTIVTATGSKIGKKQHNVVTISTDETLIMAGNIKRLESFHDLMLVSVEGSMYFPYMPFYGERKLSREAFDNHIVQAAIETEDYCAYLCIVNQTSITLQELISQFGSNPSTNLSYLKHIIASLHLNCVISVNDNLSYLLRYGEQLQEYLHIVHSSALPDKFHHDHWFVGHPITLTKYPNGYWDAKDMAGVLDDPKPELNVDAMSIVEFTNYKNRMDKEYLTTTMTHRNDDVKRPSLIMFGNSTFLNNNEGRVHNLRQGKIHVEIPEKYTSYMELVFNATQRSVQMDALSIIIEKDEDIDIELDKTITHIIAQLYSALHSVDDPKAVKLNHSKISVVSTQLIIDNITRLKALDIVKVNYDDCTSEVAFATKLGSTVVIPNVKAGVVSYSTYKMSFGSLIRSLCALLGAYKNLGNFKSCKVAKCVNGIGGSGKTTLISKYADKAKWALVCKTRKPLEPFINCGFNYVGTLEQANIDRLRSNYLIIEEASMMTRVDLLTLCNVPHMVVECYGDKDQISIIDTSDTIGYRHRKSLLDLYQTDNLTHSFRYGNPLASEVLRIVYPDLTSEEGKVTNYTKLQSNELDEVRVFAIEYMIDAVYCFYDTHYQAITSLLADLEVNVYKIHADQGTQAKNALVIYWGKDTNVGSILTDRKYVTTAFTRATDNLYVLMHPDNTASIIDVVTATLSGAGSNYTEEFIDMENFRLKRELSTFEVMILNEFMKKNHSGVVVSVSRNCINISTKIILTNLSYDITLDGLVCNNLASRALINQFKARFTEVMSKQTDTTQKYRQIEVTLADTSLLSRFKRRAWFMSTYYSAKDIEELAKAKVTVSMPMQHNSNYALSMKAWGRHILLADYVLSASPTHTPIQVNTEFGNCDVKIFDGCSLYCGSIWQFDKTHIVYVSSAHSNSEGILTHLTANVRNFNGPKNHVKLVQRLLDDPASVLFPPLETNFVVSRIVERISNMLTTATTCDNPSLTAGTAFKATNQALIDEVSNEGCPAVFHWTPTHQRIKMVVCMDEDGHTVAYPGKRRISDTAHGLRMVLGVAGMEEVELNSLNRNKLDKMLVRKIKAEFSEVKSITIPTSVKEDFSNFINDNLNVVNVNSIDRPADDDTIGTIVNAVGMVLLDKLFRVPFADIKGVDATTIMLQNIEGYTIDGKTLDPKSKRLLENFTLGKLEALGDRLKKETNPDSKLHITQRIETLTQHGHLRNTKSAPVLFIGLTSDHNQIESYREVYFMHCTGPGAGVTTIDNVHYLSGSNGRYVSTTPPDRSATLYNFGNYALCKYTSAKPHVHHVKSYLTTNKIHRFRYPDRELADVHIPNNIYKRLLARSLASDCDFEDLLAYARSLCSTMIYTARGASMQYKMDQFDVQQYCIVVINIAMRNKKYLKSIEQFTKANVISEDSEFNKVFNTIKSVVVKELINYVTTSNTFEMFNEALTYQKNHLPSWFNSFIDVIKDVQIIKDQPVDHYVFYSAPTPFTPHSTGTPDHPDDDDYDTCEDEFDPNDNGDERGYYHYPEGQSNGGQSDGDEAIQPPTVDQKDPPRKTQYTREELEKFTIENIVTQLEKNPFPTDEELEILFQEPKPVDKGKKPMYSPPEVNLNLPEELPESSNKQSTRPEVPTHIVTIKDDRVVRKTNPHKVPVSLPPNKPTILLVYAGSNGDHLPMHGILSMVKDHMEVTIMAPADVAIPNYNLQVCTYVETYSTLTNAHTNNRTPDWSTIAEHTTKALRCVNCFKPNQFDYVVGLFFSAEAHLVHGRHMDVAVIPQFGPIMELDEFIRIGAFKQGLLNLVTGDSAVQVERVWSVPSFIVDHNNIGFPMQEDEFEMDANTNRVIEFCYRLNAQCTLVTFGSMVPDNYATRIQSICAGVAGPLLVITGGASKVNIPLKLRGIECNTRLSTQSQDMLIIPSAKHKLLKNFLFHAHIHGGAGTLITFMMLHVPITIYPIAFDQGRNAEWYNSIGRYISIDGDSITKELNYFREQCSALFNVPQGRKINVSFPLLHCVSPLIDDDTTIAPWNLRRVKVHKFHRVEIPQPSDCVLHSMLYCINDEATKIVVRKAYEDTASVCTICSIGDIIALCMIAKLQCLISAINGDTYYLTNPNIADCVSLLVNADATHCDALSNVEFDEESHDMTGNYNWQNCWYVLNDPTAVCTLEELTESVVMGKVGTLSHYFKQSFDARKLLLTAMRKANVISTYNTKAVNGGWILSDINIPIASWYCLTESGIIRAISLKNQLTNEHTIYHGRQYAVQCRNFIRVNTIAEVNVNQFFRNHLITGDVCAINAMTKKYCLSNGIHVVGTSIMDSDVLYIYSTWNRPHHHEKEREVIMTAKEIRVVPKQWGPISLQHLKREGKVRCIALRGIKRWCVELANHTDPLHPFFGNWDQLVTKYSGNTYVFNLKSDSQLFNLEKALLKVDDATCSYANVTARGVLENATIPELIRHFNITDEAWLTKKLQAWCTRHKKDYNTIKLRIVPIACSVETLFDVYQKTVWTINDNLIFAENLTCYTFEVTGTGWTESDWGSELFKFKSEDKFGVLQQPGNTGKSKRFSQVGIPRETMALTQFSTGDHRTPLELQACTLLNEHTADADFLTIYDANGVPGDIETIRADDIPDAKSMDYWDNEGMLDNTIHMPTSKFSIKSRVQPVGIGSSTKVRMEEYPVCARPSLTKAFAEELNSVTLRQGQHQDITKKPIVPKIEFALFKDNYYKPDHEALSRLYRSDVVGITYEGIRDWVKQHNYPDFVLKDIEKMIEESWELNRINTVLVHGKTEQTTKLNKLSRWYDEVNTRSIMAGSYAIAAIFSGFFTELKKRFKDALNEKVFYADGCTPQQLNRKVESVGHFKYVVEDDLEKQDAQTLHGVIEIEKLIYEDLGGDPDVIQFYLYCHHNWHWRGHGSSGLMDAMRLTGQCTTAIGNAITNLIVHGRFYARNERLIKLMMILGDDNAILSDHELNVQHHGTECKELFNIVSKVGQREKVGGFLSMLVHCIDGKASVCPHFRRLRHRFSVCNHTYSADEMSDKLDSRTLSYAVMLGNIKQSKTIAHQINQGINIPDWYDIYSAIQANALYDSSNEATVENHIAKLLQMMETRQPFIKEFKHWVEKDTQILKPRIKN